MQDFEQLYRRFLLAHPHLEERIAILPRLDQDAELSLVLDVTASFSEWYYGHPNADRTVQGARQFGVLVARRLLAVRRGGK